ncbi:uncharacterized protein BCR38DRAFT_527760 [Pseudomassariella vexata]|uniref:Uncharacterized protein n=1 Tax=Pseudomassariella vexata TaxID=1141098 RepID=A0A1Y2DHK9_9PEZI|nr:uncharacterized protein BCR38DRAFT_527760 [Pseudomassariella vexata]ORY58245.1 hypothetical protein BCR38DRAFT_527760 [Pseudomassariella vexata]
MAAMLLFTASIASIFKFSQIKDLFNDTFGDAGIQTELGSRGFVLNSVAFAQALMAAVLLSVHMRRGGKARKGAISRGLHDKGAITVGAGGPKSGLLGGIPKFGRCRYMHVEKQPAITHQQALAPDDDRRGLVPTIEDEFSHEYPEHIAMGPIRGRQSVLSDTGTAYDPYKR